MPTIELNCDRLKCTYLITAGSDVPAEATYVKYRGIWFERDPQEKTEEQFRNPHLWREAEPQVEDQVAWINGKDLMATTRYLKSHTEPVNSQFLPQAQVPAQEETSE